MVLHDYRHRRLIVLNADAAACEAALAMRTNEIGAVVVTDKGAIVGIVTDRDLALRVVGEGRDPRATPLAAVMSRHVAALGPEASIADALRVMGVRRVRRVPLVERGRVVGMVTLDDLVLERAVALDDARGVVRAQIVEGGPARTRRFDEWSALERRYGKALTTWNSLVARVQRIGELEARDQAESAVEIVLGAIVRRLEPGLTKRLIARLPALVQARLVALPAGPDPSVTRASVERSIRKKLGVTESRAVAIAEAVGLSLARNVHASDAVGRKLPLDLRSLFTHRKRPPAASARRGAHPKRTGTGGLAGAAH